MKYAMIAVQVILAGLIASCPNPPEPDDNDHLIVPQEQIPWPSLADTPWPMFQHDPQHTGRSEYVGPESGSIYKKVEMGLSLGSASVGYDSNIYVGGYREFNCFDYEGNLKWKFEDGSATDSSPIVKADSSVIIPMGLKILSLREGGESKWSIPIDAVVYGLSTNIDMQGNLYFVDETSTLFVLNDSGSIDWQLHDSRFLNGSDMAPVISPDGTTLYLQGNSVSLIAIDINTRSEKWTFGSERLLSSPAIDNAGNLYFTPGIHRAGSDSIWTIYSLDETGGINWQYDFVSDHLLDNTEATIDHEGNVYFAADTLYSFQNDGVLRWKFGFELNFSSNTSLICDANNVIYVGTRSTNESWGGTKVLAINQEGSLLWSLDDDEERAFGPSPALTNDGTLIYPVWNSNPGKLIIIK